MKILTQYQLMMPVDLVIVPKNMKNGIGQRYVQLLHQTEKYRTVTSKQCNGVETSLKNVPTQQH